MDYRLPEHPGEAVQPIHPARKDSMRYLTDFGEKLLEAIVWAFVLGVASVAIAGFYG
jgi:hypothetical protein